MDLPLIPQDKANHEVYGARIGAAAAMVWLAVGTFTGLLQRPNVGMALLLAALIAAAFALLAGVAKEMLDAQDNADAAHFGLPPPHSVERADMVATAYGGLVVAAPLALAGLLLLKVV